MRILASGEHYYGSLIVGLGSIQDMKASQCPLCHVFAHLAPVETSHHGQYARTLLEMGTYELRAFSTEWVLPGLASLEDAYRSPQETVLGVTPATGSDLPWFDFRYILRETGCLGLEFPLPLVEDRRNVCEVQITPSYSMMKTWLSYCDENHPTSCSSSTLPAPTRHRVFHCRLRQIIEAPKGCPYVALSYVWGKSASGFRGSVAEFASPGIFEKVIEDSNTVTLQLGFDYFWVDRLCINQSDLQDVHHQINQMDLIYAGSALTIIAAAGTGPDCGLPGVNGSPRTLQPRIGWGRHRAKDLMSTLPSGSYELQVSLWNTRGWTFQEGRLSRRRLIFTHHQAFLSAATCSVANHWVLLGD